MDDILTYHMLADIVLALHVAVVVFVVGGQLFIVIGNLRAWPWVNALWFRFAHLAAIAFVVAEAWFGAICPFTSLEMSLRTKAGLATYSVGFIEYWFQHFLYYEAPSWVFTAVYTIFGLLVAATWWKFPPKSKHRSELEADGSS